MKDFFELLHIINLDFAYKKHWYNPFCALHPLINGDHLFRVIWQPIFFDQAATIHERLKTTVLTFPVLRHFLN